jgi:hypothetical protein
LDTLKKCAGFPKLYWFGRVKGCYAMAMDLLGPNLDNLLETHGKFSVKTTVMIAE